MRYEGLNAEKIALMNLYEFFENDILRNTYIG